MARTIATARHSSGGKARRKQWGRQAARKKKSRRSQPEVEAEQVVEREENRGAVPREEMEPLMLEVLQDLGKDLVLEEEAIVALHAKAEAYMVQVLGQANRLASHGNRVTVQPKDLHLVRHLRQKHPSHSNKYEEELETAATCLAIHACRATVSQEDRELVKMIRGENLGGLLLEGEEGETV